MQLARLGTKAEPQYHLFAALEHIVQTTESVMAEITFFNMWQAASRDDQDALIAEMRSEAPELTAKNGFVSLALWKSEKDDHRVLVEGRWVSQAHFDAAVAQNPQALQSRARLEKFAKPAPGLFTECFRLEGKHHDASRLNALLQEAANRWNTLGFEATRIRIGNINLHVARAGKGRPLILLHGYPQSGEIWRHVAPKLAQERMVVIPDLPGMGLSDLKQGNYDLPSISEHIHLLASNLGLKEVDIVAHDWGGAVAAVYALRYRQEVQKLVFIESAVGGAGFESAWNFSQPNPALTFIPFLLTENLSEALVAGREDIFLRHLWQTFTYNKTALPFEDWSPYVEAMKRPGLFHASASYYRSVYAAGDGVRALIASGKLAIPVLSISGEASFGAAQRPFVEAFAENIARHVTIPKAGHFVAEEQPEALLAQIEPFLAN
jgi:pimeloyl-ACP methyl ester carboxylesterase/heme-degrading monooxygenase HmoA